MPASRALAVALLLLACTSCAPDRQPTTPSPAASSPTAMTPTAAALPPGALVELVPLPEELPAGMTAVADSAGPLDIEAVAGLVPDSDAARTELVRNDFRDGYTADFSDAASGAFVSVLVLRYGAAYGASRQVAFERAQPDQGAAPVPVAAIGDVSSAKRERVREADVAEFVSVRFRGREIVWLVEVGGLADDLATARDIAVRLARRTS